MKKSKPKPARTKKDKPQSPNGISGAKQQRPDDEVALVGSDTMPAESHKEQARTCKPDQTPMGKQIFDIVVAVSQIAVLIVYSLQLTEMRKATNAAKSTGETAAQTLKMDRPYLSVDVVPTSDLEFTPEGQGYLRLGSTVVNYGRNPALNAKIWVQLLSQAKESPKAETDPVVFCENLENNKASIESIFGGSYYPQVPYKASWNAEEYKAAGSAKVFMPTLIACVAYQSPFSEEWLYTGKMYWIQRMRSGNRGGTLVIARGETIRQKDLVLVPYMIPVISK